MKDKLTAWFRVRNECAENEIHRVDATGAESCGLHVLAELLRLRAELENAGPMMNGDEVIVHLAPIISLARGEAQNKLRAILHDESVEVPGVVSFCRQGV